MLRAANPVDLPFIGPFGISKRGLVLFSTAGVSPQSFFEVGLAEQGPKATRTADSAFRKAVHGADGSRERAGVGTRGFRTASTLSKCGDKVGIPPVSSAVASCYGNLRHKHGTPRAGSRSGPGPF